MKKYFSVLFFGAIVISSLAQNTWIQKPSFGGGNRNDASGFSIGSKGYIGLGWSNTAMMKDFWAYDTVTNAWSQVADFGGGPRDKAVGFSIGNKGYVGTGIDTCSACPALKNDFWEYNPATNLWTQKSNFGGTGRYSSVGFSIGAKGYIGTGNDGASQNDFWEYDTTLNTWTQKAFLTGLERYGAAGFSIGSKGYIGGGLIVSGEATDFYEYNPATDTWSQKANLIAGSGTSYNVGFSIAGRGYIMTSSSSYGSDLEAYDPVSNKWILVANLSTPRFLAVGFSIGSSGYIGTGQDGGGRRQDFWKYSPCASFPVATITPSTSTTICQGDSVILTASAGTSYIWWTSETTQSIVMSSGGTTAVTVTDSCGTSTSSPITITVNSIPAITANGTATVCSGSCTTLSATGGTTYSWSPSAQTGSAVSVCPSVTTSYVVFGTSSNGCTNTDTATVTSLPLPVITLPGNLTICAGQSATLCAAGGIAYSWNTGATTSCIVVSPTSGTTYTLIASDGTCSDTALTMISIDSLSVSLTLVPDTANPLLWYGYPIVSGGIPVAYNWDFGDGNNSSQPYPTHTYSVTGNYIVCLTVTDANGCTSSICDTTYKLQATGLMQTLVIVNPLSGIEDLQTINDIAVYPNPTTGIFTIESSEKKYEIEISNVLGKKLYSSEINSLKTEIDLSKQKNGIYFLNVKTKKGTAVKKIVKQ